MPEGTEITAIRDGTVVAIKEDSNEGGPNEEQYVDKANYVWILHDDGSIANYLHLKKDGVLLNLGDKVKAKDVIALSGNTGYSTGPHLHLQLRLPKGFYSNDSLPMRFQGINGALIEGISYTAE